MSDETVKVEERTKLLTMMSDFESSTESKMEGLSKRVEKLERRASIIAIDPELKRQFWYILLLSIAVVVGTEIGTWALRKFYARVPVALPAK